MTRMLEEQRRYEAAAQKAAEERLEWLWAVDDKELPEEELPEGAEAWDGCTTCIVREVLTAAWPHLLALARTEVRRET